MTLAEITAEQAKKVLEDEQQQQLDACHAEIKAACKKYKLNLIAQISVVDGRIVANPVLVNAA